MTTITEGWAMALGSRKWHYFRDNRSLCRRFGLIGRVELEQGNDDSVDNCTPCKRRKKSEGVT